MRKVRGTQKLVSPLEVNVDTVYIRNNITKIAEDDFEGWEYEEEQLKKDEFIGRIGLLEEENATLVYESMLKDMRIQDLENEQASLVYQLMVGGLI